MKRVLLGLLTLALLLGGVGQAGAGLIVVSPNADASREGSTNTTFPFGIGSVNSQRYQQVYAATDFAALGGPQTLTEIDFRPDAETGKPFSSTVPDVQIDLSTTSAAPDALSTTFSSNVGANDTVVVPRGPLTLSSSFTGPAGGPKDFDIRILLTTPFTYDPSQGNLLLDVRTFSGGEGVSSFDAENTTGDSVSRVFNRDVNSTTSSPDNFPSLGLVTQFQFGNAPAAVPEPASLTLLGIGAFCMGGYAWRRRKLAAA